MKSNSFPCYDPVRQELRDGVFFNTPSYCIKNFNNHCRKYYKALSGLPSGFYKCPYGFAIFKPSNESLKILYNCLNIERYSDRKQMQRRINKKDFLPRLTLLEFERILADYEQLWSSYLVFKNENSANRELIKTTKDSKSLIDNIIHEVRKLNNQIKMQSESVLGTKKVIDIPPEAKNRVKNIFSTSQLISTRLDAFDFSVNPDNPSYFKKNEINIYKKFEKAKHCLELLALEKRIRISFNSAGNYKPIFKLSRIFELVPFILFENAIKYSPSNKEIYCEFKYRNNILSRVAVTNTGPCPSNKEIIKLTEKGFRGKAVSDYEGNGLGLYIVDTICSYQNIKLTIIAENKFSDTDNKMYCKFKVVLNFDEVEKSKWC